MQQGDTEVTGAVNTDVLRLKWSEKDRTVLIVGEDEDRFLMKVKEVIQACNLQQHANEFEAQFTQFKNLLGAWLHQHKDHLHKAFITVRDTRILFLAVGEDVEYDPELNDMLAGFDVSIAKTPFVSRIPVSVQFLPRCEKDMYESFLCPPIVLEFDLS